jgi:hypothetical protein
VVDRVCEFMAFREQGNHLGKLPGKRNGPRATSREEDRFARGAHRQRNKGREGGFLQVGPTYQVWTTCRARGKKEWPTRVAAPVEVVSGPIVQ